MVKLKNKISVTISGPVFVLYDGKFEKIGKFDFSFIYEV
jgi:hypothetical protein